MPYLFNGKELDTETGLYYYGARYYDPRVSIFLNVDPLTEKYPHVSPYTYTLNNPINLIDPTGMEAEKNDPNGDEKNKNPRKAGTRPEGISEKESLSQIVTIDGKKYHKNTGNLFAEIGNKINSFFGGNDDYFVEHKPYDPVADGFIHEAVEQSAGTLIGGAILKTAGGVIKNTITNKVTTSKLGEVTLKTTTAKIGENSLKFAGDEGITHFSKHSSSIMKALGKTSYNLKNYINDANFIVKNGTYIPQLNGYVRLIGGKGSAKFGFVGLNRTTGNITTFHIKTAQELAKKASNMFSK